MSLLEESSKRGYTDLLTGSTQLLDIPSNALFKFLIKGRLPPVFLPSFLHEATHFWCMSGDLGATLALLELRAHHEVVRDPFDRKSLIHDLGVTKIVHQLLEPLLEGMALFQEFDALSGDSRVISTPAYWASVLFQPLDEEPPEFEDPEEHSKWLINRVRQLLIGYRLGDRASHRKVGALMRSITNDPHHYLSGYLTLKQLAWTASGKTPAFADQDLFLTFLKDWIFQDWEMIGYLINPELSCVRVASLASARIQNRLTDLATKNLTEEVTAYDQEMDDGRRDPKRLLWSLRQDPPTVIAVQKQLASILEVINVGMKGGEDENWYLADRLTLNHRQQMMRLASEPVEIEVTKANRVVVRKGATIQSTYLSGPAPPEAQQGVTPGWMTAYFLPNFMTVVALAVRENQAMLAVGPTEIPADEMDVIRLTVTKVVATESARRDFTELGRRLVKGLNDVDYETVLVGMPAHVRKVFTFFALSSVPANNVNNVETVLSRKGLYDLLGRDGDLLTALVKISLFPPVTDAKQRKLMSELLAEVDIDLDKVLPMLQQIHKDTGMPLVLVGKDNSIWPVI